MLKGSRFVIRTVLASDLDTLLELLSDTSKQGDYRPLGMLSQAPFRRESRHARVAG